MPFAVTYMLLFSSGNSIKLHPMDKTVFLLDDAKFDCLTLGTSIPYWRLNGTDYDNLTSDVLDDLRVVKDAEDHLQSTRATIKAKSKYNETRFECVIESNNGDIIVSENGTLYIQGKFQTIIHVYTLSIDWICMYM